MKILSINNFIGGENANSDWLRKELADAKGQPVKIEMSSPGGLYWEGVQMSALLSEYKGTVHTHNVGVVASAATPIYLSGNKKTAMSDSVFMIHNPSSGIMGADYREAEKFTDYLKRLTSSMVKMYSKKTGKEEKEIKKLMDDESYFFGEEMKVNNFADEIIESEKKESKEDATAYAKLSFDECMIKIDKDKMKSDLIQVNALLIDEPENKIEMVKTPYLNEALNHIKAQHPVSTGDNKTGGNKIMTLDDLRSQHSALYNEVFNLGKEAGKKEMSVNIEAHAKWFEADPKAVMENISKGEEFTMAHLSAYTQSAMVKSSLKDRVDDNVEDVKKGDDVTKAEKIEEAVQAKMFADLGLEVK
jgi:ATP-dependent Clp protease, protease subunit